MQVAAFRRPAGSTKTPCLAPRRSVWPRPTPAPGAPLTPALPHGSGPVQTNSARTRARSSGVSTPGPGRLSLT